VVRWNACASSSEQERQGGSVLPLSRRERKKEEGNGGVRSARQQGRPSTLGSWPRRQVARGAWRTRGGDDLRLSGTEGSFQSSMASTDSAILGSIYS
jgi:hypothetical protein